MPASEAENDRFRAARLAPIIRCLTHVSMQVCVCVCVSGIMVVSYVTASASKQATCFFGTISWGSNSRAPCVR